MLDINLIDNSVREYLGHYYRTNAGNFFDYRQSYLNNLNTGNYIFALLLSDYEDAERVYNYCRDISGRNLTLKQKRNRFINEIFKPYNLY